MGNLIKFAAAGDSFITRRLPSLEDDSFSDIASLLKKADVRFNNLEVTVHNEEGFPSAFSGGTWALGDPSALDDIESYGFNLINFANNHTLDYSYGGLIATKKYLSKHNFVYAGAGENLSEASDPKYLDCGSGRIGFIAATSTFHDSWIAGEQRRDMIGRPGINPLRYKSTYVVSKKRIEELKDIANDTDINAVNNLNIKEGFEVQGNSKEFKFGNYVFSEGINQGQITEPDEADLKRIGSAISEAKRQSDYVIVSIHSHEMKGEDKSAPADFLIKFARFCIDSGANAVIGHGPHVLRPIEIYKNSPIFYSLGNFIFQSDTVRKLPSDFYEKYNLGNNNNTADAFDTRSKNNTIGLGANPYVWESVIPVWEVEDNRLKSISLYPIELGYNEPRYKRGWPHLSENAEIIKRLQHLSKPFGTNIKVDGSVGKILL